MNIAVVSAKAYLGQVDEDQWLVDALIRAGAKSSVLAWDDEGVDWQQFDRAVVRSAWGYHHSLQAFETWMDMLGPRLINPVSMIRENIYKHRQFAQLRAWGLPHIQTVLLSNQGLPHTVLPGPTLQETIGQHFGGSNESDGLFVIKPFVSASGHNTLLVDFEGKSGRPNAVSTEAERHFTWLMENKSTLGVMLQPFLPSIDQGEYALCYMDGQFSHAALRYPAVFRRERGVLACPEPPADVLALGEKTMSCLNERPAYARVDIVDKPTGPVLMELELAEPCLFFRSIEPDTMRVKALDAFAQVVMRHTSCEGAGNTLN